METKVGLGESRCEGFEPHGHGTATGTKFKLGSDAITLGKMEVEAGCG